MNQLFMGKVCLTDPHSIHFGKHLHDLDVCLTQKQFCLSVHSQQNHLEVS
jgi:hypothetical protein